MATTRRNVTSEDQEQEVLAKIKEYQEKDFPEAGEVHELIMQANPSLCPRLWYGMPGYAKTKDSAVLCFFRKDTMISFGVTEAAKLNDDASIFPSAWCITRLDKDAAAKIVEVVAESTK